LEREREISESKEWKREGDREFNSEGEKTKNGRDNEDLAINRCTMRFNMEWKRKRRFNKERKRERDLIKNGREKGDQELHRERRSREWKREGKFDEEWKREMGFIKKWKRWRKMI
jgi:hypothetical protein